jgi:hypothetical protein
VNQHGWRASAVVSIFLALTCSVAGNLSPAHFFTLQHDLTSLTYLELKSHRIAVKIKCHGHFGRNTHFITFLKEKYINICGVEDHEVKASLGYTARPCLKKTYINGASMYFLNILF